MNKHTHKMLDEYLKSTVGQEATLTMFQYDGYNWCLRYINSQETNSGLHSISMNELDYQTFLYNKLIGVINDKV